MEYKPSGFVIYTEILCSQDGLVLDKNCEGGFSWFLKGDYDPQILFPEKNSLRLITDLNIVRKYITDCINLDVPIKIYFAETDEKEWDADFDLILKIKNISEFLGYDCISPDMDYSPLYEASMTNVYGSAGENLCSKLRKNLNKNGYCDCDQHVFEFMKERQKIIGDFCQQFSLEKIDIIPEKKTRKLREFVPVCFWKCDTDKLLGIDNKSVLY